MFFGTTAYSLIDELGNPTTITLPKYYADALQHDLHDVHAWVQSAFVRATEFAPHLSRRRRGDLVRQRAESLALRSHNYRLAVLRALGATAA